MRKKCDRVKAISVLCFLLLFAPAFSQELEIKGGFFEDSIGIGEEVHFWMTASYPADFEMILPDSTYDFGNYEYSSKYFTESQQQENIVFDSAVYGLISFEIDPIQYLSLTAFTLSDADSISINTPEDSIYYRELVDFVTDTTKLITNTQYSSVNRQFNFPLLWIILGSLGVILVIVLLVFGKKIRTAIKIRKMKKDYEKFSESITVYIRELKNKPKPQVAEDALKLWKGYLEKLEEKPYTKLTTKEILSFRSNQELRDTLKSIDRTVYGRVEQTEIFKSFQQVEDFTQHRYAMILDELKSQN